MLAAADVVELAPLPRGCPFQRRGPHRLGEICDREALPWRAADDGHAIRCHIPLQELQVGAGGR